MLHECSLLGLRKSIHNKKTEKRRKGDTFVTSFALAILAFLLVTGPTAASNFESLTVPDAERTDLFHGTNPFEDLDDLLPHGKIPHVLPYRRAGDAEFGEEYGIALQLTPLAVGSEIRWHTTTAAPVQSPIANTQPHVWVKIEPKPTNSSFFLAFVIALFTISATGVMLMWRQVGKPTEPDRPGWESWRH